MDAEACVLCMPHPYFACRIRSLHAGCRMPAISRGLISSLIRLEQKLWFIELDMLLIILTILGGSQLLYQHGVGIKMVANFRPFRPEVVVRHRSTIP